MQIKIKYPLTTRVLVWAYLYSTYFKSKFWNESIDETKVKEFLSRKLAIKLPQLKEGRHGRA